MYPKSIIYSKVNKLASWALIYQVIEKRVQLNQWIHTSNIRSMQFRPISKLLFWALVGDFYILTYIGACPPEEPWVLIGQLASIFYFAYFLVITPVMGIIENKLLRLEI